MRSRGSREGIDELLSVKAVARLCAVAMFLLLEAGPAAADVAGVLAEIEGGPRGKRVAAYESLADRRGLSDADRAAVVKAFAGDAKKLSPAFGESAHRIDTKRWRLMLDFGLRHDPKNRDMLFALCQLLIDEKHYADALPVARVFAEADPDGHAAKAWKQWCEVKASRAGAEPKRLTIPLHFCVLTRNPAAQAKATREQCQKEVEILNAGFRGLDGTPLVTFTLKGFTPYAEARTSKCPLLEFGDSRRPYDAGAILKAFNACEDAQVRDPGAINVYVYDSHSAEAGYDDQTSHGTRNSNRPYVLIDWERLGGNIQNAEVHEMGHAFGLDHVGVPGAGMNSSTNIMTSAAEGFGSGGKRDLGFSESQAALILYHAERTRGRLGLPR